ncbi:serine/threonine-protein phosphatase 2A activator-like [Drosophila hydei]|uniref:Serine/threonine-protein phosphatase 2A activator n=1 Tax=Drosophila hydei TaxID=7224 RepID=A0A6J1LXF2_DROHY|nr:serine/threonine-protein phosphatase 2A activator-like [Drosophila hydei]
MDEDVSKYFERSNNGAVMRVRKESDMALWYKSQAYHEVIAYINRTGTAIQGIQQLDTDAYPVSPTIRKLCRLIDELITWLRAIKLNTVEAYRAWSRQMLRNIFKMLETALPVSKCEFIGELGQYLACSFGNFTRADYGTGHELSFLFFLCGLFQAKILCEDDEPAAALMVFARYLKCVRNLQLLFELKPSGNQGAYSLDNYQFVAYMWGAAQLCYDPPFSPKELLDRTTIDEWQHQYLIVGCVAFVASTKQGSFAMHSNQLWSIATLSSWTRFYSGLHNMYLKEVISQFHLLRELWFGQLLPFEPVSPATQLLRAELGHLSLARQRYLLSKQNIDEQEQEQLEREQELELELELQRRHQHHRHQQQQQLPEATAAATKQLPPSNLGASHSAFSSGMTASSLSGTSVRLRSLSKRFTKLQKQHAKRKPNLQV